MKRPIDCWFHYLKERPVHISIHWETGNQTIEIFAEIYRSIESKIENRHFAETGAKTKNTHCFKKPLCFD